MTHASTTAAFVVAAALLTAPIARAGQARREQHVFVGVTDKANAPIAGLTTADFTIREDGTAREIVGVTPAPPPTHVALLVDDSARAQPVVAELRRGLLAFVGGVSAWAGPPAVGLTTFGGRPAKRTDYTSSWPLIEREIGRLFPQSGSGAFLIDAIIETCQDLKKKNVERPIIVVFLVEASPEFSNDEHTRVADALKGVHASLWTVVLEEGQPDLGSEAAKERAMVVGDVTASSGGTTTHVPSKTGIEAALASVVSEVAARYDVAYSRPDATVPPTRLSVEVKDPAAKVLAPHWTGR